MTLFRFPTTSPSSPRDPRARRAVLILIILAMMAVFYVAFIWREDPGQAVDIFFQPNPAATLLLETLEFLTV